MTWAHALLLLLLLLSTAHDLPVTTIQRSVAVSPCSALLGPDCIWRVMLPRTKRGRGWGCGAVGVLVCGWAAPRRDRVAQFVVSMGETVNNKGRDWGYEKNEIELMWGVVGKGIRRRRGWGVVCCDLELC